MKCCVIDCNRYSDKGNKAMTGISFHSTCPNTASLVAEKVRRPMRQLLGSKPARPPARLHPLNDPRQVHALSDMGISVLTLPDGRVQLLYTTSTAKSAKDAAEGLTFMREMSKWNSLSDMENGVVPAGVKVNDKIFPAGPRHFGKEITPQSEYANTVVFLSPLDACTPISNKKYEEGKFGIAKRGMCTFAQKVHHMQNPGAALAIIINNVANSTHENTALFAMSGDGKDDIEIPAVFLFTQEGRYLTDSFLTKPDLKVIVSELKSLKARDENNCNGGSCETVLQSPAIANDKESFEHLKKVLSQLAAQFELSLSTDDQRTCSGKADDITMLNNKYNIVEDSNVEGPSDVCTIQSNPVKSKEGDVAVKKDNTVAVDEVKEKTKSDNIVQDGL